MTEFIDKQEMVDILNNEFLLPSTKTQRLLGLTERIVRCKDCTNKYLKGMNMYCPHMNGPLRVNDYCNYGKRGEDE